MNARINPATLADLAGLAKQQATKASKTGPRVERETIDAMVASLHYITGRVDSTTGTVAAATLPCGYVVALGFSACIDPAAFDADHGERIAIEDAKAKARSKLWELEGYAVMRQHRIDQLERAGATLGASVASHDFGWALAQLKAGRRVTRNGWNGKGMWLDLQRPDANSRMTLPYIFLSYPPSIQHPTGARVPWLASQTDMLETDWRLA